MIKITAAEFDRAVEEALELIPDDFAPYLENVVIEVLPRPTLRIMTEFDVPDDLLGLYVGTPIEDKGMVDGPALPDRVLIFRENLIEICETRDELIEEIRITVLHEVGHHFGLDEDRLAELGYE